MMNTISWESYWTFIAVATLGYYLFVYLVYFRKCIGSAFQMDRATDSGNRTLLSKEKNEDRPEIFDRRAVENLEAFNEEENDHIVHACMDELNAFFESQKKSKAVKSELMHSLYTIIQKFPSLRNSAYKDTLTNVIATQCENICSIHLSAEELRGVWFG